VVLPEAVAVLIVVLAVEFPAEVWARTAPDVDFVAAEEVTDEPESDEPSQVPLLLMLCQLPVISE